MDGRNVSLSELSGKVGKLFWKLHLPRCLIWFTAFILTLLSSKLSYSLTHPYENRTKHKLQSKLSTVYPLIDLMMLLNLMLVLPRWSSWPMWLPTEALPPSTLTSMHWRWHQNYYFKRWLDSHKLHILWQEVHQDEMEILGVPCGQFFNVRDLAWS